MEIKDNQFLISLAKGIASQFGPNCEVVIHDMCNGFEHSITHIENGHVTGRSVGDDASEIVLKALVASETAEDHYNYITRTKNGSVLKSSTIHIRDDDDKVIGVFGINFDITQLIMSRNELDRLVTASPEEKEPADTITGNVSDLLDILIEQSYQFIGKPVSVMTKEDKIKAIKFLSEKGAFLIKKSGDKISKFYDISKYTLYNYLDADTSSASSEE